MNLGHFRHAIAVAAAMVSPLSAHAASFESGSVTGDFTSTLALGTGVRTTRISADYISVGNVGGPAGANVPGSYGDTGDLAFKKGQPFTTYVKGVHELLLNFPDEYTFMGRVNWLKDFSATDTSGYLSSVQPIDGAGADGLTSDARKDLKFKARLLDFWVSKKFTIDGQQARIRVGNQVVSWGESLFTPGGINQTNAVDINKLSQPGTQLKEAVLPAPIVSFATGLGHGLNAEAYYQGRWNASYLPPVGGYWSTSQFIGTGSSSYGVETVSPKKDTAQWGVSLRWQPTSVQANFGLYYMRYVDKTPQADLSSGALRWVYPGGRQLIGASVNVPLGDWAVGSELSYRPKDAVAINTAYGCASTGGKCWVDQEKYQWHLTGLLSLTPNSAGRFLDLVGASGGTVLAELAVINYPGLKQSYGGSPVAAGLWPWGNQTDVTATPYAAGTKLSSGISVDASITYDGTVIPGWQLTPEIFYSRALNGRTPNIGATFMKGAQAASFVLTLSQNPLKWQFGLTYSMFWGGKTIFDQPFRDRDFAGAYASYTF